MTSLCALVLATRMSMGPFCPGPFAIIERGDPAELRKVLSAATIDQPGTARCARRTPLLLAAEMGRLDAVKVLLELGADLDFTVVERDGPMQGRVNSECLARANGHEDVARLLKAKGAKDTVDGCRKRSVRWVTFESREPERLALERKNGNRLSLPQLEFAVGQLSCTAEPELCVELVRHLPKEPSDAKDRVVEFFEDWAVDLPAVRTALDRLKPPR